MYICKLYLVVALSSGEGSNNYTPLDGLIEIESATNIEYVPFNDEVELFIKLNNVKYDFDSELKHITGYNPRLLGLTLDFYPVDIAGTSHVISTLTLRHHLIKDVRNFASQNLKLPSMS